MYIIHVTRYVVRSMIRYVVRSMIRNEHQQVHAKRPLEWPRAARYASFPGGHDTVTRGNRLYSNVVEDVTTQKE